MRGQWHFMVALSIVIGVAAIGASSGAARGAAPGGSRAHIGGSLVTVAQHELCVGGKQYKTTLDDEFTADTTLNYSPAYIGATPQPNGAIWSSRANYFSSNGARNNVGTDDAYYTDPSRGFGGYSPYTLSSDGLSITAIPVPSPYATAPALEGAHWLSGLLESQALTYGYVEVDAKVPNLQGWWPAALWLEGLAGADGRGDGYEELDVNELFGLALPPSTVQQTQTFSVTGKPPSNYVRTVVAPNPQLTFHRYGVLWTPSVVRFYIDRQPTSPDFPNAANGPANAIINLSVFAQDTWSPAPANKSSQTMYLQAFRWYQATSASCSPTAIQS